MPTLRKWLLGKPKKPALFIEPFVGGGIISLTVAFENLAEKAEVFGYATTESSDVTKRYRTRRLCPFNNKVPNCTKDKAKNPIGVCSVFHENKPVITCPIRFRQDWIITDHAADFFFPKDTKWTTLTEVRLNDYYGKTAGNIDVVRMEGHLNSQKKIENRGQTPIFIDILNS